MKAFCLAFAFLLGSLPAIADELPQTSNAWRATEPDLAEPGNYQWTVVDDAAGGAQASAAAPSKLADQKAAPARAALAQIRAETARIMAEARKSATKVSRIRYELRLRCVVEQVDVDPKAVDARAAVASGVVDPRLLVAKDGSAPVEGSLELCEIDYSQKVRSKPLPKAESNPEFVDYNVAFPVN